MEKENCIWFDAGGGLLCHEESMDCGGHVWVQKEDLVIGVHFIRQVLFPYRGVGILLFLIGSRAGL